MSSYGAVVRSEIDRSLSLPGTRRYFALFAGVATILVVVNLIIGPAPPDLEFGASIVFGNRGANVTAMPIFEPIIGVVLALSVVLATNPYCRDLQSGVLGRILLVTSGRLNLISARAIAVMVTGLLFGLFAGLIFIIATMIFCALAGTLDGQSIGVWARIGFSLLRLGIVGAIFANIGMAISIVAKRASTVLIIYAGARVLALAATVAWQRFGRFDLWSNVSAFVTNTPVRTGDIALLPTPNAAAGSGIGPLLVLIGWFVVIAVASTLMFLRSDLS